MTHMAAISLYIDNYRTDTHDLREDLRMENKQYLLPPLFFILCPPTDQTLE